MERLITSVMIEIGAAKLERSSNLGTEIEAFDYEKCALITKSSCAHRHGGDTG